MSEPFYMVGPRYAVKDVTMGLNSVKLEKERGMGGSEDQDPADGPRWTKSKEGVELPKPVAGPIVRLQYKEGYQGRCMECGRRCKVYKRAKEPALWRWARAHRCANPNQVGDTTYVEPRIDRRPW